MAKRKATTPPESLDDQSTRSKCIFFETRFFTRALDDLAKESAAVVGVIRADVVRFQGVWRQSRPGQPLPKAFQFKILGRLAGEYRVCQIYVGHGNFRTAILFIHEGTAGYMIDIWKKTKNVNKLEIDTAMKRAAEVWERLRKEGKEGHESHG